MNFDGSIINIGGFAALTLGIVVTFLGRSLTDSVAALRTFNIPEPVSGGLAVALVTLAVFVLTGREVVFELAARDALLIYFFTIVGLNARLADLRVGGRPLALLLALTIAMMLVQTLVATVAAVVAGLPAGAGVLLGTAALVGGHGTAIAWGPAIAERTGMGGAAELGIAMATLGLIAASFAGGPIAKWLIERDGLTPAPDATPDGAFVVPDEPAPAAHFDHIDVMRALLAIHGAIFLGMALFEVFELIGLMVPRFLPCLLAGIALSNTLPHLLKRVEWPARGPAMAMISDFSLSIFLAMSLMSMQLWTVASALGLLIFTTLAQVAAATAFIVLVVYRVMGRDYFAAVLSAGFAGFALGSTPTAIANMGAVTRRYGPAPLAFIVLPLVSAFFVDLANAGLITMALSLLG